MAEEKSIIRTTEEDWDELPKAQRLKLEWRALDKWNWHADIDGEELPARIRAMDAKTFACYRNAKHLGCEATLESAKKRIDLNIISEFNRVARAWEKEHPFELPSRFLFTQAERDKFRDHAPPARPREPGVAKRSPVVSAPRKEEAAPAATAAVPVAKPAPAVRSRSAAMLEQERAARSKRESKSDYKAEITTLLKRGCTSEEVLRVTGWKAISMPAMAKSLGLELEIDKGSKPFRYKGK
jgi:hypothetical protein